MSAAARIQRALTAAVPALLIAGSVTVFAQGRSSITTSSGSAATTTTPIGALAGAPSGTSVLPAGSRAPGALGVTGTTGPTGPTGNLRAVGGHSSAAASAAAGGGSATTPAAQALGAAPPSDPTPLPTVPGAVADPGQPTATAPGTYRYTITTTSGDGPPSQTTMTEKVVTKSVSGGVTVQQVTDAEPQAQSSAQQQSSSAPDQRPQDNGVQEVAVGPQGNLQLATDISADGQTVHCSWSPPILELPAGLVVGRGWTLAGSCTFSVLGQQGTIQINGQGRVTGAEVVRVAGDDVSVWVVSDGYTVVVHVPTLGVAITLHHVATDRVSGRLGLIVAEDATDTFSMGTRSNTIVSHQTLQSIHPS